MNHEIKLNGIGKTTKVVIIRMKSLTLGLSRGLRSDRMVNRFSGLSEMRRDDATHRLYYINYLFFILLLKLHPELPAYS